MLTSNKMKNWLYSIGIICLLTYCAQKESSDTKAISNSHTGDTERDSSDDQNVLNPVSIDEVKNLPAELMKFVPDSYSVLDTAFGNLNQDKYVDLIMVLRKNGEDTLSNVVDHPEKRKLLILLRQEDNTYKLAVESDNAVYCVDCGGMMGDPFMNVVIKNGYFSVEHYGGSSWRWTRIITFKYSPIDSVWYLHKDGHESFHAADPGKVESKILTKKNFGIVRFEDFNIYGDK